MDTLLPVSALSVLIQDYESLCAHVGHYFRTSSKHCTRLGHSILPTQHPSRQQIRKKKIPFNWQKSLEAKKCPSLSWKLPPASFASLPLLLTKTERQASFRISPLPFPRACCPQPGPYFEGLMNIPTPYLLPS